MRQWVAVIAIATQIQAMGFCSMTYFETPKDLVEWTCALEGDIQGQKEKALQEFQKGIDVLLQEEIPTFSNTIKAWDSYAGELITFCAFCEGLGLVHPDKAVQKKSDQAQSEVRNTLISTLLNNPKLYQTARYLLEEGKDLSSEDQYYLDQMCQDLERMGCHLSEDKKKELFSLQEELTNLSLQFQSNIRADRSFFFVEKVDLEGVSENVIKSLEFDEEKGYKITCDYPVFIPIMSTCSVASTRKQLLSLFSNRAYPANKEVLDSLIKKRGELASLLGFSSFADYELSSQMAKNVETATAFISRLFQDFKEKINQEFSEITKNLPEGVILTKEGKLQSHDVSFVTNHYRQSEFSVDDREISEYFTVDSTLEGLISIYEQFFSLKMQEITDASFWHPDVRLFQILSADQQKTFGYLILDLFPRNGKYSHACCAPLSPAYTDGDKEYPAVSLVVTNFPKKTETNPAFLIHDQARVLFHEFGHAIHNILGRSNRILTCGTQVKTDFVELPSQLLEEWLWDAEILKKISVHYETKKPLPDELITKMLKARNCDSGLWLQRQCFLSNLSLAYFKEGSDKNIDHIVRDLRKEMVSHCVYDEQDHFPYAFSHLDGYGSKYYGYLWARVLAADVFAKIKEMGLLNPKAGDLYVEKVLGKGGRDDPNKLLQDFLEREPSNEFFIQNLRH